MELQHTLFPDTHLLNHVLDACVVGVVVADARQDDCPVVYVNPAFEAMSGYAATEIVGRNCRFLQGEDRDQEAGREIRAALAEGRGVTAVLRNYRRDGRLFYNELTLSPVRDGSGALTHFLGFQNDVTAREEALRAEAQTRQHLTSTLERMSDGFVSFDRDWNVTCANTAAELAAHELRDVSGQNPCVLSELPSLLPLKQAIRRAQETGLVQREPNSSAMGRQADVTVYPENEGVSVFIRDVTESRQAQRELQVSEERFSKVFQASPVAIYIIRQHDKHFMEINAEFSRLSGYAPEEIIGHSSQDLGLWASQTDREEAWRMIDGSLPIRSRELLFLNKAGREVYGVASLIPMTMAGEACVIGFVRDVTEEKRARDQLQASEVHSRIIAAELQHTLDLSADLIASIGPDNRFKSVSAASTCILGYAPEEMIGRPTSDFIHPDDRPVTFTDVRHIPSGAFAGTLHNRYLHRNGKVVWLEWSAMVLPDDGGVYMVGRDVTQRRAAEEDQAFLAAIVHASHNAIIGLSLGGSVRSSNPGVEQLYGYTAEELIGRPVTFLVPDFDNELFERARRGQKGQSFESSRVTRSGRQIQVMTTLSPVLDADGEVIGVSEISRDVTALRQAEGEIRALNEDLRRQLSHVTGLREIDQSIAASAELGVTLGLILDNIMQQLDVEAVTVHLLDQNTLAPRSTVSRGFMTGLHDFTSWLGEGLSGQIALNRQPLLIPDLRAVDVSPPWRVMLEQESIMAYYGAPIMAKGNVLGVIEVLHRKPFEPSPAWLETFDVFNNQAAIAVDSSWLFTALERRNLELRLAYDETIEGWARALDLRDKETEGHSRRVTEMTVALCRRLGLSSEQLVHVRRGALLHDIGKMGIPDAVLLKPGDLTDDEWILMRNHPEHAVNLLSPIGFLRCALDIPKYHHERWDGGGYPLGLQGEAIPITARAFAVVDVYDALTSDRPYRHAWTKERALKHIQQDAGFHFDPQIVQAFIQMLQDN
ncbi:PAS domain S-box protein [Deinococcus sp. UYEF24]